MAIEDGNEERSNKRRAKKKKKDSIRAIIGFRRSLQLSSPSFIQTV